MDFSKDLWFTIKVGDKEATRRFHAKWSFAQEEFVVPQDAFLKVAAELGAKDGEQFFVHNPLN